MNDKPNFNFKLVCDEDAAVGVTLEELKVGMTVGQKVRFSQHEVSSYASLIADFAPVHTNSNYAQSMGFDRPIVHGFLLGSRFSRILGMYLPGPMTVIQSVRLNFIQPVLINETVEYTASVKNISLAVKVVMLALKISKNDGKEAVTGQGQCVYRHASS